MKFLVLWKLDITRLGADMIGAVIKQSEYGRKLEADGKLECRYHIVGGHGGAWIYKVKSNEELDRLLATAPVFNFAHYDIIPLAEMADPATVVGKS
jgi:muconolactone delta-isomerase